MTGCVDGRGSVPVAGVAEDCGDGFETERGMMSRKKCEHCGMYHGLSLEDATGRPVRPVSRRELRNQLSKDSLEYTVTQWAGGKAICLFDRILGRLWQAAANGWREGREPAVGGLIERLKTLGVIMPQRRGNDV